MDTMKRMRVEAKLSKARARRKRAEANLELRVADIKENVAKTGSRLRARAKRRYWP